MRLDVTDDEEVALAAFLKGRLETIATRCHRDFAPQGDTREAGTPATYSRAHGQLRKTREEILTR
jgi:hypothetical protein